jgi:hypothetical protein
MTEFFIISALVILSALVMLLIAGMRAIASRCCCLYTSHEADEDGEAIQ